MEASLNGQCEVQPSYWVLQWDEFLCLLSGATWADACSNWSFENLTAERRSILPTLSARYTNQRQFLFSDKQGTVQPLEVYWLKIRLFSQLCDRLVTHYRNHQRPHLGLSPNRIQVKLPEGEDPLLPARWGFTVELSPSQSAMPFVHDDMPPAFAERVFQPTHAVESIFQSPEMRRWPLGHTEKVTLLVRSLERMRFQKTEDSDVRGTAQLHIPTESIPASAFSEKDIFLVHLPHSQGHSMPVSVWGTKVASAERGLILSGVTDPMPLSTWEYFKENQHQVWNQSTVEVYRAFHLPCDLYSLGIILFHTLLGVTEEATLRLQSVLPPLCSEIEKIIKSIGTKDSQALTMRIRLLLIDHGVLFSTQALVHPDVKTLPGNMEVPHDLWFDGLALAVRLVTRIPGFSFCGSSGDYEQEYPERVLDRVIAEVNRVGQETSRELFDSSQRNRDILRACQIIREERSPNVR